MTDFILTFLNSDYAKGGFKYRFTKHNNCYEAEGFNHDTHMYHVVHASLDLLDTKNPLHVINDYMW